MTFVPAYFTHKNTPASDPGSMCLLVSSYDFCPPPSTGKPCYKETRHTEKSAIRKHSIDCFCTQLFHSRYSEKRAIVIVKCLVRFINSVAGKTYLI